MNVQVLEVIDGNSLEVGYEGRNWRVILAGIGFPPGDERALKDAFELIDGIARDGQFRMAVWKEVGWVMYVDLQVLGGDSLNELMLRKGFARFESRGIGLMNSILTAEDEARAAKLGIWNRNRELSRNASNSLSAHGVLGENSRMINQVNEDESLPL
ncbi:MAG: thermonuclease family protein [Opitutaceae bacterium]|nr:thermonuclease family protein [Opitutaceae bacterium]